ncbi:MAG: MFS transporter [Luteitalea sp.]|nr:MFS transporter [Luteitalea sp.]
MRAFHMTWFAFFLCFFAWFGIAPLMAVVRDELGLTRAQVGNTVIASVAVTIVARLFIGWLCDRLGPRVTYTWLLILGSLPVMGIGLAQTYETFLLFRLAIGVIGASFVITQYHSSVMFAPNVVGTANATTAGWGNLGGGVTQIVMPLLFTTLVAMGLGDFWSWRLSMVVAGLVCMATGVAYHVLTQDCPEGNYRDLAGAGAPSGARGGGFREASSDPRVWALFVIYGACFGVELTINNIAALYFMDYFDLGLRTAGVVAGLFGLMNLFARTLGGVLGDRAGLTWGLRGRVTWLAVALAGEGVTLMLFSQMTGLAAAIATLILFSLFVQMSEGATYAVVPFVNPGALGSVAGIVGAGGNCGAVLAGFLFRTEALSWPHALFILGGLVLASAGLTVFVRFSDAAEAAARQDLASAPEAA